MSLTEAALGAKRARKAARRATRRARSRRRDEHQAREQNAVLRRTAQGDRTLGVRAWMDALAGAGR